MSRISQYLGRKFWQLKTSNHPIENVNYPKAERTTDSEPYLSQIAVTYTTFEESGLIEPKIGWLLRGRNIIGESYPFWTNVPSGWPPLPDLASYLNPFKRVRKVQRAASFHYGWDNYYHFFIDLLPVLHEWMEDKNYSWPILVPEHYNNAGFVQDYFSLTGIFENKEVIEQQPDEFIKIEKQVGFKKTSRVGSFRLKKVVDELLKEVKPEVGDRKIFLTRSGYRSVINREEINGLLQSKGFEVVDTSGMSLTDQISMFSQTRFLVGIHGAGLTNMIFRKDQKMSVMEVFPSDKVPCHYWHLTLDFGYNYNFCIGGKTGENEQFHLDPDLFSSRIDDFLVNDKNMSL